MDHVVAVLVSLAFFATIFGWVYVYYTTRHRERMALIEKGADASIFSGKNTSFFGPLSTLKLGMFLTGIALGILAGSLLTTYTGIEEGIAYISMIFLFGGLSLVLFYFYARNKEK
ncbi:MAG: hypothetical protein GX419_10350 [Bacteroidales bacterium]|jgi:SNF family Na+-dependent transporter|nr:hypothetical protein [Bacteroidales bacterium]